MKKNFIKGISALFMLLVTVAGCDRDRYDGIQDSVKGSWTLTQGGIDKNYNSMVDGLEIEPLAESDQLKVDFNENGSYSAISATRGNVSGRWFEGNNKVAIISGSDTSTCVILSLTQNQLVMLYKDPANVGNWLVYRR